MFDVFYIGKKPGLFSFEKPADSIEHARQQSRTRYCWVVNYLCDYRVWDWLWEPVPWEADFCHAWPTHDWYDSGTYLVPAAGYTETKYHSDSVVTLKSDPDYWFVPDWVDPESVNYTWRPHPADPPYIYEFGVEWGWDHIGGPEYRAPGGAEKKYVDHIRAKTKADPDNFEIKDNLSSTDDVLRWRPNPTEQPYVYVFGNQWYPPEQRASAIYRVPGAVELKYVDFPKTVRQPDTTNFVSRYACEFDYSWEPNPGDPPYIYVFGNQHWSAEIMPTVEYHVPGATERKYMDHPFAKILANNDSNWKSVYPSQFDFDYSWVPDPGDPPYIYVFGNQWHSAEVMPTVEYHVPGATERKYMSVLSAQLAADMTNWHIPNGVDVRDMDFSWVPDPGEPPYIYQFATQHQKTGGPQYRVAGATEIKYLDMMRAEVTDEAVPIFEIDHLDGNAGQIPNTVRRVRYFDNYKDTLVRLAKNLKGKHEHVWVCSSICDYTDFDFSWHPETWQSTMLHVFASDEEKLGDTFYMHVPTFAERAEKKELLEWYNVNFVPRVRVARRPLPVIRHSYDTHVAAVKTLDWSGPLAVFTVDRVPNRLPTIPLWREKTKIVTPLNPGASSVIVPKTAVPSIKTQLYDYEHIDKTHMYNRNEQPLDVVFISNGEVNADQHWQRTTETANGNNRAVRVDGVNGRVAAYRAAAEASQTPWFFAVFAKLEVETDFDWSWQPDRLQQPKHYIFHAHNPVTGLEYGHMAMVAYNKQLVLQNAAPGLDFTLDQEHEVVPILSGVAHYHDSAWMAWRTAFRECIKLRHSLPDVENEYRLQVWLGNNLVGTENGEWSRCGAADAVEYYDSVAGDFAELRRSYDWAWLADYAFKRRGLTTDQ